MVRQNPQHTVFGYALGFFLLWEFFLGRLIVTYSTGRPGAGTAPSAELERFGSVLSGDFLVSVGIVGFRLGG